MICKVAILLVVASVVLASPYNPYYQQPYAFKYGVQDSYSGQNFGRKEISDGNVVKGTYSVDLPDGRQQTVDYQADKYSGFQAKVSYTGQYH
ncbi:larval cuticle protein A3A-like isoform X2 [Cherax quadricarinatus]|uniref:larval cuticle protein A3A-like isoform X2 n=1 Tax=Cherax quadricarinatus TaxID=27406 RepID=UPI0023793880|nr:larval cuticle protein A3A-like isoform X2 [Cherax quadricarinatus]